MNKQKQEPMWQIVGCSVRGASHERTGLPNQDAIGGWVEGKGRLPVEDGLLASEGMPVVVAVSDGHGSGKCFRSDIGSQFAVEAAETEIRQMLQQPGDHLTIKKQAEEALPSLLVKAWREKMEAHLAKEPFSQEEQERVRQKEGEKAWETILRHPALAYGATLLAVGIRDDTVLYVQLGDGDILQVDTAGKEVQRPLGRDERLIANETTSLCIPAAHKEVRVKALLLSGTEDPPSLILLSTDGYSNSFASDDGFLQTGIDYLQMIREQGIAAVKNELTEILGSTSRDGSGDDITLGILKWSGEQTGETTITALEREKAELKQKITTEEAQIDKIDALLTAKKKMPHGSSPTDPEEKLPVPVENLPQGDVPKQSTARRALWRSVGLFALGLVILIGIYAARASFTGLFKSDPQRNDSTDSPLDKPPDHSKSTEVEKKSEPKPDQTAAPDPGKETPKDEQKPPPQDDKQVSDATPPESQPAASLISAPQAPVSPPVEVVKFRKLEFYMTVQKTPLLQDPQPNAGTVRQLPACLIIEVKGRSREYLLRTYEGKDSGYVVEKDVVMVSPQSSKAEKRACQRAADRRTTPPTPRRTRSRAS